MAEPLLITDFLNKIREENTLLLDVRSPKEYHQAHIPGAVNLPLLDDEARKIVGTTYKQLGREAAVLKGFDLVGKKFGDFVRETKRLTDSKEVMIYCWRGGMRSNIMSWVLNMAGFKTWLLKGGYKSFRTLALKTLSEPKRIIVLGGKTGSGKTELLEHLKDLGQQTICLETLANHRGSAYGGLGMKEQPRNEMFENMLALEWMKIDSVKVLWLENESHIIGSVMLPKIVYEFIRTSPMIEIEMRRDNRIKRIIDEYGEFPTEDLVHHTKRLYKRLGGLRTHAAISALMEGSKEIWVDEVLGYYDKTYQYGNETRENRQILKLNADEYSSMKEVATQAIYIAEKISLEKVLS